jgi:chromosome segregation ATPase
MRPTEELAHRGSRRRPLRRLVVALVSTLALTGCGEASTADLCTQYDQVVTKADEIKKLDVSSEGVDDLRTQLKDFQASLDQLQAVADGRLDTAISDLRAAIRDFVQAAVDAGEEALETAQPLLEDSLDRVRELWAGVQERADAECD